MCAPEQSSTAAAEIGGRLRGCTWTSEGCFTTRKSGSRGKGYEEWEILSE